MSITFIPEDNLRNALRPYRVDSDTFEAAVRARLKSSLMRNEDAIANLSPALRCAAAFLPLEVIAGGQLTGTAVKLAPATGAYKLLSYVAFPAISLFVLLGATIFSIVKIRSTRDQKSAASADEQMVRSSTKQWWRDHKWGAGLLFTATLAMSWIGATWLLFLGYIVSVGLLLYVLKSFTKIGLGNRVVIGQSCLVGLTFLGQIAGFPGIGDQDIHMVDQGLIVPLFFGGAFILALIVGSTMSSSWPRAGGRNQKILQVVKVGLFAVLVIPLMAWYMNPILWPAKPARIKTYVESFDSAPFSSASWQQWEIVASWAVESKLDPDLTGPRRLLAAEMAGEQNPFILGSAFRVGLVRTGQLSQLKDYEKRRQFLLDDPNHFMETRPITSLEQEDWVIRASALRNDLTAEQRNYLEKRLDATLDTMSTDPNIILETPLRATQLLEVIQRPVDRDQYRERIYALLRKFHSKKGGGFQVAGGFKQYNVKNVQVGTIAATSCAVELMEIYGIPDDLDMNWVRSFLRPLYIRVSPENWMAAVTLDRLNRLPGVTHPTWLETIYSERSLLAAMVLVGLCIYATLSSPNPKVAARTHRSSQAESLPDQRSI